MLDRPEGDDGRARLQHPLRHARSVSHELILNVIAQACPRSGLDETAEADHEILPLALPSALVEAQRHVNASATRHTGAAGSIDSRNRGVLR
jgi:hypothetical protein